MRRWCLVPAAGALGRFIGDFAAVSAPLVVVVNCGYYADACRARPRWVSLVPTTVSSLRVSRR